MGKEIWILHSIAGRSILAKGILCRTNMAAKTCSFFHSTSKKEHKERQGKLTPYSGKPWRLDNAATVRSQGEESSFFTAPPQAHNGLKKKKKKERKRVSVAHRMKISIIEWKRMRHGIKITSIIIRLGKMPRDLLAVEYAYIPIQTNCKKGGGGGKFCGNVVFCVKIRRTFGEVIGRKIDGSSKRR